MRLVLTPECLRDLADFVESGKALCNRMTIHTEDPQRVYTVEFQRSVVDMTLHVEVLDPAKAHLECVCRPTA
jgi:hypothetical protein